MIPWRFLGGVFVVTAFMLAVPGWRGILAGLAVCAGLDIAAEAHR